jgi:hypothetical protein
MHISTNLNKCRLSLPQNTFLHPIIFNNTYQAFVPVAFDKRSVHIEKYLDGGASFRKRSHIIYGFSQLYLAAILKMAAALNEQRYFGPTSLLKSTWSKDNTLMVSCLYHHLHYFLNFPTHNIQCDCQHHSPINSFDKTIQELSWNVPFIKLMTSVILSIFDGLYRPASIL